MGPGRRRTSLGMAVHSMLLPMRISTDLMRVQSLISWRSKGLVSPSSWLVRGIRSGWIRGRARGKMHLVLVVHSDLSLIRIYLWSASRSTRVHPSREGCLLWKVSKQPFSRSQRWVMKLCRMMEDRVRKLPRKVRWLNLPGDCSIVGIMMEVEKLILMRSQIHSLLLDLQQIRHLLNSCWLQLIPNSKGVRRMQLRLGSRISWRYSNQIVLQRKSTKWSFMILIYSTRGYSIMKPTPLRSRSRNRYRPHMILLCTSNHSNHL